MEDDADLGSGCLSGLLSLVGFLFFWRWLDKREHTQQENAFTSQMAFRRAPRSAAEWNAAVEEGYYDDD